MLKVIPEVSFTYIGGGGANIRIRYRCFRCPIVPFLEETRDNLESGKSVHKIQVIL